MPDPASERGGDSPTDLELQRPAGGSIGPDPFASIDDQPKRKTGAPTAPAPTAPQVREPATRRGDDWLAEAERSLGRGREAPSPETAAAPPAGDGSEVDPALRVIAGGGAQGPRPRVSMHVVRGGVDGEPVADDGAAGDGACLQLGNEAARRLADDLVAALAATYPAKVARARADGQWSFHLGEVIRDAREDFHSVVSEAMSDRDELFNQALMRLVSGDLEGVDGAPDDPDPGAEPSADGRG